MELIETRSAYILALIILLVIPAVISGLQIGYSSISAALRSYPGIVIAMSTFFYIFVAVIPAWSYRFDNQNYLKYEWFVTLILLYLLFTTLLFSFGQVLWSYVVLIILLILSIFPLPVVFKRVHPAFACMYLISFLWLVYLFIAQTVALFKGEY